MKEINHLNTNKATQSTNIPTKRIKENSDIFEDFILEIIIIAFPILFFQTS